MFFFNFVYIILIPLGRPVDIDFEEHEEQFKFVELMNQQRKQENRKENDISSSVSKIFF